MTTTIPDFLLGTWTYRSFLSNPDINVDFDSLEFGRGNIRIDSASFNVFSGLIYGPGWQLTLSGSCNYGDPMTLRFQGVGVIMSSSTQDAPPTGEGWIYDYEGYVVKPWPNGIAQVPAIVGTLVRVIPHSNGKSTAGVVAQWIAVKQP